MGIEDIAAAAVILGAASLGYTAYSGEQNRKAQSEAQDKAEASALKQEKSADEAVNAANKKTPNTQAILASMQQAAKGGLSSTMLTGSSGIDTSALQLGKSSLLGS